MESFSNPVNKRIVYGYFPLTRLYPSDNYELTPICIEDLGEAALKELQKTPEALFLLFKMLKQSYERIELVKFRDIESPFLQEVNILINSGYPPDSLNMTSGVYQKALNLIPVVTRIDKIVWWGIFNYYFELDINLNCDNKDKHLSMMYAWISILSKIQENEQLWGITIDIDNISPTNIIDLLLGSWESIDRKFFSELTATEKNTIFELFQERKALDESICSDFDKQRIIAKNSEEDWKNFLNIINDLSERERNVITSINDNDSSKEKISAIYDYFSKIEDIRKGQYVIDNCHFDMVDLIDTIIKRFEGAPQFCTSKVENGKPFILNTAITVLTINPETFNYLMMTFHLLRLEPNSENAIRFARCSLLSLNKNLGTSPSDPKSLDDIIGEFYNSVMDFVKNNKNTIDSISYKSIKMDTVSINGLTSLFHGSYLYEEKILEKMSSVIQSTDYYKSFEELINGASNSFTNDSIRKEIEDLEKIQRISDNEVMAMKIVYSLNIIYMFCEALRIIINNKRPKIHVKDKEYVKFCRRELLKIDDYLVHRIYSSLNENEIGMLEYREKIGVDTSSLSEREFNDESYRNNLFSLVFKDAVSRIINNIDPQNIEQIFESKNHIRDEIMRFPDCDEKEQYAAWLDEFSTKLSNTLINWCKQNEDDFPTLKKEISKNLGNKSNKLPTSTLDSLVTAEMLYKRYASEEFANIGFDYSCISALYYQAFEDAYNYLIWKDYASSLNSLIVDGLSFTSIMESCKTGSITSVNAQGYLDDFYKTRFHYIKYANSTNPTTTVNQTCMYKSFAILMSNISSSTKLDKFCDYIANISGHKDSNDMFTDKPFMQLCKDFTDAIESTAESRNNASHGGTAVSLAQCIQDRQAVLYNMDEACTQSISLIQMLLQLIK